ncbi:MAG TPA: AAA family ATPase [Stellaceae bacterium]|nr:AAA family ATPase [Stellaceae bacterium]
MKLISFQITNYRSINDSGEITTDRITAVLGRNESGKSNLLRAIASLNPPGGMQPLSKIKDFPRHRRLTECSDSTSVVKTIWELGASEREELAKIFPRAKDVVKVEVCRPYDAKRTVQLLDLPPSSVVGLDIAALVRETKLHLQTGAEALAAEHAATVAAAVDEWETATVPNDDATGWPARAVQGAVSLRKAFTTAGSNLPNLAAGPVSDIERYAIQAQADPQQAQSAWAWVVSKLPIFVFLDDFPELSGHQHVGEFNERKANNQQTDSDENFAKLCKVAGLDPAELHSLGQMDDHESRNQLVNRASAVVTGEVRRLWKDRPLKIRFNLDAEHLDTLISDPNETYDVEVNLDERSRGFRWFFSFYIVFSADTQGGNADGAILLLDEPGLFLHAMSQSDLLKHFDDDFNNQIIYTTHSPFMVPTHAIDRVRTANISQATGTTISNDPVGDARTLFPLQSALGYSISQSLFLGTHNLILEGVTDYWIVSSISTFIAERGGACLDKRFTLTPVGGASKVSYMVALLTSERLRVVVLLDDETQGRQTRVELLKAKLIRDDSVAFVTEAFADLKPAEADIEDLLDPGVFDTLIRESYAKEIAGRVLTLNANIPRIAKRYEAALEALDIEFFKTRPARLLLAKMGGEHPETVTTPTTIERFERLFGSLNKRLDKITTKEAEPFG